MMKKKVIIFCVIICIVICFVLYIRQKSEGLTLSSTKQSWPYLYAICFDSLDDIKEFTSLVYEEQNEETYKKFTSSHYLSAQEIATQIGSTPVPIVKDKAVLDAFGADYYVYSDSTGKRPFDISYIVDGVLYRFLYSYNDAVPASYNDEIWLENQTIGSVTFDLYKGNKCLCGSFMLGDTEIHVMVNSQRIGDINFEHFEFVSLSQTSE